MAIVQPAGNASTFALDDGIAEMQTLIRVAYPDATFSTESGEDPDGVHLLAHVDATDFDEVIDVFIDRLIDLQIEDGLRLHVIPMLTPKALSSE